MAWSAVQSLIYWLLMGFLSLKAAIQVGELRALKGRDEQALAGLAWDGGIIVVATLVHYEADLLVRIPIVILFLLMLIAIAGAVWCYFKVLANAGVVTVNNYTGEVKPRALSMGGTEACTVLALILGSILATAHLHPGWLLAYSIVNALAFMATLEFGNMEAFDVWEKNFRIETSHSSSSGSSYEPKPSRSERVLMFTRMIDAFLGKLTIPVAVLAPTLIIAAGSPRNWWTVVGCVLACLPLLAGHYRHLFEKRAHIRKALKESAGH
jgi:hypothetical protein